jgi:cation diffusion facilitator CzcD-associated flavoprotein CzcO
MFAISFGTNADLYSVVQAYPPEATYDGLTRNELREKIRQFASEFDLRVLHRARVERTEQDENTGFWELTVKQQENTIHVTCKQLVLATGVGFAGTPKLELASQEHYKGTILHSTQFKNADHLVEQGIKVGCQQSGLA